MECGPTVDLSPMKGGDAEKREVGKSRLDHKKINEITRTNRGMVAKLLYNDCRGKSAQANFLSLAVSKPHKEAWKALRATDGRTTQLNGGCFFVSGEKQEALYDALCNGKLAPGESLIPKASGMMTPFAVDIDLLWPEEEKRSVTRDQVAAFCKHQLNLLRTKLGVSERMIAMVFKRAPRLKIKRGARFTKDGFHLYILTQDERLFSCAELKQIRKASIKGAIRKIFGPIHESESVVYDPCISTKANWLSLPGSSKPWKGEEGFQGGPLEPFYQAYYEDGVVQETTQEQFAAKYENGLDREMLSAILDWVWLAEPDTTYGAKKARKEKRVRAIKADGQREVQYPVERKPTQYDLHRFSLAGFLKQSLGVKPDDEDYRQICRYLAT